MGALEHIQRFTSASPYIRDEYNECWKKTKAGGARRGFLGGWATVFEHRPINEADKRKGFDYCLMFVHEEPQRKIHGGTFLTLAEALSAASSAIKLEQ